LVAFLEKIAPENPPVPLNARILDDSNDSEDLAADEFFRFMIWNDLSEEEADEKQISLKMGSWNVLSLLRTFLLLFMISMVLMTDMTNTPLKHPAPE
jgi:hypothetical protein